MQPPHRVVAAALHPMPRRNIDAPQKATS